MTTTPDDVLDYWFGDTAADQASVMALVRRWFRGGPEVDAEIRQRFGDAVLAALAGELDAWADAPRTRLALVILLDQFTRNVFRDDARTYAGDPKARALVLDAFDRGLDAGLGFAERIFLSMPLLHSEELAHHERLAALSPSLTGDPPPGWEQFAAMNREQCAKYHDIITRFGRFPHRNALLGRTPTQAEDAFMAEWAARAAPSGLAGEVKPDKETDAPRLGPRFSEAFVFAEELHRRQVRKGSDIPYLSHLMAVASLVMEHGGDEDVAVAALLHDAVEDQGGEAVAADIRARFGGRVADIVLGCSDSTAPKGALKAPWRERKERYLAHFERASPEVRLVSIADKLHNCRCTVNNLREEGPTTWNKFNATREDSLWFYRAFVERARALLPSPIVRELDRAVTELEALA